MLGVRATEQALRKGGSEATQAAMRIEGEISDATHLVRPVVLLRESPAFGDDSNPEPETGGALPAVGRTPLSFPKMEIARRSPPRYPEACGSKLPTTERGSTSSISSFQEGRTEPSRCDRRSLHPWPGWSGKASAAKRSPLRRAPVCARMGFPGDDGYQHRTRRRTATHYPPGVPS